MGTLEPGRITAVGLDLGNTLMVYDGVPLNWQQHYAAALGTVLAGLGRDADKSLPEACARLAKYNTRLYPRETECDALTIFTDVLEPFGISGGDEVNTAVDAFFGYFRQTYGIYPDVMPLLQRLQAAGIPAGILTDVPYGMPERWVERDVGPFRPYVKIVLSSVDAGFRKPNTGGFRALANALGANPQQMAYIGDEEKDIIGAKAAGMMAILIDRKGTLPAFGEDLRLASLDEVFI